MHHHDEDSIDNIFSTNQPNQVTEISIRYLQNIPIYFPSEKYKLSIRSFIATQYFIPNDNIYWCPSQKDDWWR